VADGLISVEEAQARALAPVRPLGAERVGLADALGRVLAEEVRAPADVPPHDNSAMDGYAVRALDAVAGARLRVIGTVAAGQVAARPLVAGEAWRIMTGAPIPEGADTVVMQEHTTREGDVVQLHNDSSAGAHVRDRGEDLRAGDVVLAPGATLDAAAIGVLASARRAQLAVTRRPVVAVVSTGDELRDLDQPIGPGAIAETNSWTLAALVRAAGGVPRVLPLVPDDPARIAAALTEAAHADLVVSTGGVSVGEFDHVKDVLAMLQAPLSAWRVDMKPGKPVALAVVAGTPFYGLPGNPVSAMVAFTLFVRPAIRAALGCRAPLDLPRARARLSAPLEVRGERRNYLRARLAFVDGQLQATAMPRQGSGVLTSMLDANGLLVVAGGTRTLAAGDEVDALVIGPLAD
jgi:molybdopterin molybdotransferase